MQSNRSALFRGRHLAEEIIVLGGPWYLRFSLSYRDLEELRSERKLRVDHTTVWRWGAALRSRIEPTGPAGVRPRVINVDGSPSYPQVVKRLKQERTLGRRCRCRTCPYLNNIIEQDHRAIKPRINAKQGFRSLEGAQRTIPGYEVMHMIRKGQVRWLLKGDVIGQVLFINLTLGLTCSV